MPGRDGTGPVGLGKMSGRGFGLCANMNIKRGTAGLGIGCRGGYKRNFSSNAYDSVSEKELLAQQKTFLESRLDSINKKSLCEALVAPIRSRFSRSFL